MPKTMEKLSRMLVAFLIVLFVLYLIYPEGFNIISKAFTDNIQLILILLFLWLIISILRDKF